jgi:hypothetical protein
MAVPHQERQNVAWIGGFQCLHFWFGGFQHRACRQQQRQQKQRRTESISHVITVPKGGCDLLDSQKRAYLKFLPVWRLPKDSTR